MKTAGHHHKRSDNQRHVAKVKTGDFDDCFGGEDGEALLARVANRRLPVQEARP